MRPVTTRIGWWAIVVPVCLLFSAPAGAQPLLPEAAGEVAETAQIIDEDGLFFELKNNLLSVDIQAVPLHQVLEAISQRGKIEVALTDPADEETNVQFAELPLDKGLEEILKGRDYMFVYGEQGQRLKAITVYSRQQGQKGRRVQSHIRRSLLTADQVDQQQEFSQLVSKAFGETDPDARLEAVAELGIHDDEEQAAQVLSQVLEREESSEVREAALEAIADFDQKEAQLQAAQISIDDAEQDIRLLAVELLGDLEAWDELRQVSQTHQDPEVREIADEALEDAE